MNPHMVAALDTMREHFGAIDRADFQRKHPEIGDMLAMGLLSQGFARPERGDRLVMTDAGWRAAKDQEGEE